MRRRTILFGLCAVGVTPAFALYDPQPDGALSAVQGEWYGTLTYRDYSEPKRMVTLPTRLYVALDTPSELVLSYAFDDGPSKTVFSYEKMRFDFAGQQVTWSTGPEAKVAICTITADHASDDVRTLVFERSDGGQIKRFTLMLSARAWTFAEDEVTAAGVVSFRNKYAFTRAGT